MTNCRFKVAADLSVAQPQAAEAQAQTVVDEGEVTLHFVLQRI